MAKRVHVTDDLDWREAEREGCVKIAEPVLLGVINNDKEENFHKTYTCVVVDGEYGGASSCCWRLSKL